MLIAWLAACGGGDPELARQRQVLDAWTAAAAQLEAGDSAAARATLEAALAVRPEDPLLLAWSAKAAADGGDLDAALERIDRALAAHPDFPEALYNRAAWFARAGRPDEAGPALVAALATGVRSPRDVLVDPDFAAVLAHPAFDYLPRQQLVVAVDAPTESAFWGSELPLRLRITGAAHEPITVTGPVVGPVEVVQGVEEIRRSTDGPMHDLTWQLRVVGAGTATIGPLVVSSGPASTEIPAIRFECGAPEGKSPPVDRLLALWAPSGLAGAWGLPSAVRAEGLLWVKVAPGDRIAIEPPPGPGIARLERREGGVVTWTATGWRAGPAEVTVTRRDADPWRATVQ